MIKKKERQRKKKKKNRSADECASSQILRHRGLEEMADISNLEVSPLSCHVENRNKTIDGALNIAEKLKVDREHSARGRGRGGHL